MAVPFDYVQIVSDDDWELVGIVAPGSAGDRVKGMSATTPHNVPLKRNMSHTPIIIRQDMAVPSVPQITPADSNKKTSYLPSGITLNERQSPPTYDEIPDMVFNLSGLARNRANVLVGFGK